MSIVADFEELGCDYAGWWQDGLLEKIIAVDCIAAHSDLWGVVDAIGQDAVQAIMADAFAPVEPMPSDYASQLVRDFELADHRDRWRWTGELPPVQLAAPLQKSPYRTAQSTIDAFHFVMGLGDPARLAEWLRNHPDDAAVLLESVEAA